MSITMHYKQRNMDFDPIINYALLCGMWWTLPWLAMISSDTYSHFKQGTYNKYSRIALAIKGASSMMKTSLESQKIKKAIIEHITLVFPFKYNTMSVIQEHANKLYYEQKKALEWCTLLKYDLKFGCLHMKTTIFYLVQMGVIMMKYGLHDTMIFKLMETHIDNAIYRTYRTNQCFVAKKRKTTFRRVVQQIINSKMDFIFLYTFQKRNDLTRLPEYAVLNEVLGKCEKNVGDDCLNRLPSCVRGGVALLAFIGTMRKNKNITNNARVCYSSYKEYIQKTEEENEANSEVDIIEIID